MLIDVCAVLGALCLAVLAAATVGNLVVYVRIYHEDRERLWQHRLEREKEEARAGRDEITQAQLLAEVRSLTAAAARTGVDERRRSYQELRELVASRAAAASADSAWGANERASALNELGAELELALGALLGGPATGASSLPGSLLAKAPKVPILITGAWLRKHGSRAEMLTEIDGKWRLLASEEADGVFSYISEPAGMRRAPVDDTDDAGEPTRG